MAHKTVTGSAAPAGLRLAEDLVLPIETVTDTLAIMANRGAGKSATARRLVEQLHHAGQPVVILDVKGDWWGIRTSADGAGPGLPFVIFGGDHADVPLEPTAGELLADLVVDDRVPAVLDLSHMSKSKARGFATDFAERLYRRNRDPLHVVIEEADVLIPQRASADTARLLGAMEDIAKRGRSRGLGMTLCTQRGQEVAKSVLELMETVILLRMTGPRSIKAVQDWISVNADVDDDGRTAIASLPTLRTGEAWVWSPAFLKLLKRVQILRFETFDSHATPQPGQIRPAPKGRVDIDLDQLGAEIAATAERARANNPAELRSQLAAAHHEIDRLRADNAQLTDALAQAGRREPAAVSETTLTDLVEANRLLGESISTLLAESHADTPEPAVEPVPAPSPPAGRAAAAAGPRTGTPAPAQPRHPAEPVDAAVIPAAGTQTPHFRKGAQRMLESLARMAPLRLTKSQWGTVSTMRHTSGTFSTYLGELRRAGFIDQNDAGFTLTDTGFAFLGRRPSPMTGAELQQHYRSILRAGASRMLDAILGAHPGGLTREQIAAHAEISPSSGTFSTYLGELRRNGLIEARGQLFMASDVLVHGADQRR
jgi:hypothetical protein